MGTALRTVPCVICNRQTPETKSVRAGAGRHGSVSVWLCKACAEDPKAAAAKRKALR